MVVRVPHGVYRPPVRPSAARPNRLAPVPTTLRRELARKAIHLASAAVPTAYAAGAPRAAVIGALAVAGTTAAGLEIARARSPRVRAAFTRVVGRLLRTHEHGRWSGATWMCAAYLLSALLFPRPDAVAAMLAVAFGDAAAAIVGRLAARLRPAPLRPAPAPPGAKTAAGSIACAAATALGALLIARTGPAPAAACGIAAALAERPRWPLDDNIRVALAAGAAAWTVAHFM